MGAELLPMVASDRRCSPRMLENPVRRRFLPASRELGWLGVLPDHTVADVGAGVGFFDSEILRRLGARGHLYVVDPDESNLAIARRRLGADGRAEFAVASAARLANIPDESVDRVLLSLVICCLVDKEGAMDEVWRVLRPGGRVLVTYPRRGRPGWRCGPSLRVRPERWVALESRRPWRRIQVPSTWFVARHLLERPAGAGRSS